MATPMLAIARPNPYEPPTSTLSNRKKGSPAMLRRMHSNGSSGTSLAEVLARKNASHSTLSSRSSHASRSNGSGDSLDDILARIRNRQNPAAKRKNPDSSSMRDQRRDKISSLGVKLAEARKAARDSLMGNSDAKIKVEMLESQARAFKKELAEAASELRKSVGDSSRKSSKRSASSSSSRKTSSRKRKPARTSAPSKSKKRTSNRRNEAESTMLHHSRMSHRRNGEATSLSDLLRQRREALSAGSSSRSNGASLLDTLRANGAKRKKPKSKAKRSSSSRRRMNEGESVLPLLEVLRANAAKKRKASAKKTSAKKTTAKKATAKKATAKKSVAKKSTAKVGGAKTTKFYSKVPAAKRAAFVKQFDLLYKKYNAMSGVTSAQARARAALAANAKIKASRRKNGDDLDEEIDLIETDVTMYPNPRRKSAKRKTASRKRKTAGRSGAVSAKSTKFYAKLPATKKAKFVSEFNKLYKSYHGKKGVSAAQAAARAALAANARVRRNPADASEISVPLIANPKRKTRKSASRKSASRKKTSTRMSGSARSAAMKSAFYKKLPAAKKATFVREFEKLHKKYSAQRGVTSAQARARAALAANARVKAGRKNPAEIEMDMEETTLPLLANPKRRSRKSSSVSRRKSSSVSRRKSKTSGSRVRAKRFKTGMRDSAKQVLSKYGPYEVKIQMNGKVSTVKANKSSSDYLSARKSGLHGGMRLLSGKKNSPASLNLRSVYKVVDGKPSRSDFQRAVNVWAGAVDGGHIRGVSKRHLSARMNAVDVRRHTIHALENPAPMHALSRYGHSMHENAAVGNKMMATAAGVGVGAAAAYGVNWATSAIGNALGVTASDVANKKGGKFWGVESGVPALVAAAAGFGLYQEMKKRDSNATLIGVYSGAAAGAVMSFVLRTFGRGIGASIPGFAAVSQNNAFESAKEKAVRELKELKAQAEDLSNKIAAEADVAKKSDLTAKRDAVVKSHNDKLTAAKAAKHIADDDTTHVAISGFLVDRQLGNYPLLANGDVNMPNRIFGFTADRSAGLGRYVEQSSLGRYVEQSSLGRYVDEKFNDAMESKLAQDRLVADVARAKMDAMGLGMYETSAQAEQEMHSYDATGALMGLGDYEPNYGGMIDRGGNALENYEYGYSPRSNPAEFDEYAVMFDRMNPAAPQLDAGGKLQVAPVNTQAVNDGMYSISHKQLKEDLELYEPLSAEDMKAEGIAQVSDTGEEYKIVRATPDVARQIVEANFGNLIGASRVVPNTLLVLASIYDAPQAPVLTDRLRLNRAPEVPKSASFPQAGGLFSRVVFSSIYPSIDNMPSFQEFGVRPNK